MTAPTPHVIAIDWSGDARAPHRKIWLAEVVEGVLVDVRRGAPTKEMAAELIQLADAGPLIVGLDFAFSFPEWFVRERLAAERVEDVWDAANREGEDWLQTCEPPFWGRPEKRRPSADESRPYFRRTEDQMPFPAKSVFQIGGGGAVGTGSIRGMPLLGRLRDAGFRIWPFDDANGRPLVIEIYPRVLTRAVVKSSGEARRAYLEQDGRVPRRLFDVVASEEDPFDAAISALVMAEHTAEIGALRRQSQYALEGAIWQPRWSPERRYLDPGLPDEPFVLDYPDGSGEGPYRPDQVAVDPDGTVTVQADLGTPRVLRIVDVDHPWLISRDGSGKRWRLAIRAARGSGGPGDRFTEEGALVPRETSPDWEAPPAFAKERPLQDLIATQPSLLPGIDEGPAAVATEVRMPGAGRADVVVVDAVGQITIVECKLASNSQFRRWVVGQTLEYAGGLWKLAYKDFERAFAARRMPLIRPFKDVSGWDEETFRRAVAKNLDDGSFRLIIAVDRITEELKRTVGFVNTQTPDRVQLLAVKMVLAEDGSWVSEVHGQASAEIEPLDPSWPPDRWTLMESIRSTRSTGVVDGAARAAESLIKWAESQDPPLRVEYKTEEAVVKTPGGSRLFRIRLGEVRVSFDALGGDERPDDERIRRLVHDLDVIGVKVVRNKPRAPLKFFANETKRDKFLALMGRVLET